MKMKDANRKAMHAKNRQASRDASRQEIEHKKLQLRMSAHQPLRKEFFRQNLEAISGKKRNLNKEFKEDMADGTR